LALLSLGIDVLVPFEAMSQSGLFTRPEDTRPELPPFEPPKRPPGEVLPPIPLPQEPPQEPELEELYKGIRVPIKEVRIEGNTVLPQEELDALAAGFVKKKKGLLTFADLERLRDLITWKYIKAGYETSGATIPDQTIEDGVVMIQIIEGVLDTDNVNVETDGRLRKSYIKKRLLLAASGVINTKKLEKALQILQQNPRIKSVKAELRPTDVRGKAALDVKVIEAKSYRTTFQFDNQEPPSVGAERGLLNFSHLNVTGFGDTFFAVVRYTIGLRGLYAMYEVPLNARGTTFDFHMDLAESEVVEDPFDALDIEGKSRTFGVTLAQPVYRSMNSRFGVFAIGEKRRSKSFLGGRGFQFTEGPSDDGVSKVTVLRFGQDWSFRTRDQAFALRNTLSIGLDCLGATSHDDSNIPDGQFIKWFGQVQYARRFILKGIPWELIARGDVQLSDSPLLNLERVGVGGYGTVRGYRQDEYVRDNAVIGSVELRFPFFSYKDNVFELAPFFDIGRAWNVEETPPGPKTLSGVGAGIRWRQANHLDAFLYWGHDLKDINRDVGEYDLQDDGIYFRLAVSF
jgi:hemolysin activation/secretion protein